MKKIRRFFVLFVAMIVVLVFSNQKTIAVEAALQEQRSAPAATTIGKPVELVMYDPATGTETILPAPKLPEAAPEAGIFNLPSQAPQPSSANLPEDFGALVPVGSPELFPWRVNVKVNSHFPGMPTGSVKGCSGVLIDPQFVLTAGHCVHAWETVDDPDLCNGTDQHCFADEIQVAPGYENGTYPYGIMNMVGEYTATEWSLNHNEAYDMGFVYLDRPVGAITDWFGFGYNNTDSFFTTNPFTNPGYPGYAPYDGEYLYTWSGTFDDVDAYHLYFDRAGGVGQSGSGSYHYDSGVRVVYAVLAGPRETGGDIDSRHTRLTSWWSNAILSAILDKTPDTVDLVALDVQAEPGSIGEGSRLGSMNYLIHNYSEQAFNGTVNVSVYLSENDTITSSDILIQTHTSPYLSLPYKASARVYVDNLPVIPFVDDPEKYWYIGVMLNISDAKTTNNDSSGQDAAKVWIANCSQPSAPILYAPADYTYTQDRTPYFDWATMVYADRYEIWVDNSPADWLNLVIDAFPTPSEYTPSANLADGAYAWGVRAQDTTGICEAFSDWSPGRTVVVDDTNPGNPTNAQSSDGHHYAGGWSNDNTPSMEWWGHGDATSGVQGFGVYWSTNPTYVPIEQISVTGANFTSSALADGALWYFHVRSVDWALNWASGAYHQGPYKIDTVDPVTQMTALPATTCGNSVTVSWSGQDGASGIDDYYVQYRVGAGGTWVDWKGSTSLTSATFGPTSPVTVVPGQTYYFRAHARDNAGNTDPYPGGNGDTWTTFMGNCVYIPLSIK